MKRVGRSSSRDRLEADRSEQLWPRSRSPGSAWRRARAARAFSIMRVDGEVRPRGRRGSGSLRDKFRGGGGRRVTLSLPIEISRLKARYTRKSRAGPRKVGLQALFIADVSLCIRLIYVGAPLSLPNRAPVVDVSHARLLYQLFRFFD